MKKGNILGLILLVLATLSCGIFGSETSSSNQDNSNWKKYKSNNGNYSILFPVNPTEETTTMNTAYGYVDNYSAKANADGIYYSVVFNELPSSYLSETTADGILDLSRSQMVDSVSGTLLSEKIISIDNYPGRELRVKFSSGSESGIITVRVYVVEYRIYRIVVSTTEDDQFNNSINKFLNSFTLE